MRVLCNAAHALVWGWGCVEGSIREVYVGAVQKVGITSHGRVVNGYTWAITSYRLAITSYGIEVTS